MKIGGERDAFVVITFGSATLHRLQPVLGVKRTNCDCECVQRARLSQSLHLLFIASVVVVVVVVIVFYATDRARLKNAGRSSTAFFYVFLAFLRGFHSCGIPFPTHQKKDSQFTPHNKQIHNRRTHKKASDVLSSSSSSLSHLYTLR